MGRNCVEVQPVDVAFGKETLLWVETWDVMAGEVLHQLVDLAMSQMLEIENKSFYGGRGRGQWGTIGIDEEIMEVGIVLGMADGKAGVDWL